MSTCVIAEDEALLREALVAELRSAWPELEIVAECADGGSALEAIAAQQPDVAFLDIRMPGLTGLEVAAAALEASPQTQVVFVTAYDQYAVDAFETGAVDYLLKPIVPTRLAQTVQRVQGRLERGEVAPEALAGLLRQLGAALPRPALAGEPLAWLTASGEALLRKPIKDLLAVLDTTHFKQVHRSTIVNLRAVESITRDETGRGLISLKSRPETLVVSQPYMALFRGM